MILGRHAIGIGLAAALATAPFSEARAQLEPAQVGLWRVAGYFDRGAFTHCAMSASYNGGAKLLLFAFGRGGFTLGIADRSWNLRLGGTLSIYFQIDGGPASIATARVQRQYLLAVSLAANAALLDRIRFANTLKVGVVGSPEFETTFSMPGSNPAFARLAQCTQAGLRGDPPPRANQRVDAAPGQPRTAPPAANPPRAPERAKSGTGTGFLVTRAGHVLTADHVVRGCKTLKVQVLGDVAVPAVVVASSQADDLALLKTDLRKEKVAAFRANSLRLGEPIVVYGFPLQGVLTSSGNLTTGNIAALAGLRDDHRKLQISAPVQPGNSGGPVFDMRARVIGVVVSKLDALRAASITGDIPQNINFAVKTSVVLSFLEAHGIGVDRGDASEDLPVSDVAERARAVTARIECLAQ